jgi:hypothetical protein
MDEKVSTIDSKRGSYEVVRTFPQSHREEMYAYDLLNRILQRQWDWDIGSLLVEVLMQDWDMMLWSRYTT